MSGKATGWVLEHGPRDRADRSVLIVIADASNQAGEHAYPGIEAIVSGSLYSKATVYAVLRRLEDQGWIEVEQGRAPGRSKWYRIPGVADATWEPNNLQPLDLTESDEAAPNLQQTSSKPPIQPDPSLSLQPERERKEAQASPSQAEKCPATMLLRSWCDERIAAELPRPAQPWPAMLSAVRAMLSAGHTEQRVAFALRHAPIVSAASLTLAIESELRRRAGPAPGRESTTTTALRMIAGGR